VFANPPFLGGCLVDCSGTLAAVGNYGAGQVSIYDITDPSSPKLKNTFDSGLGPDAGFTGNGALSLDGKNLLVGELNGPGIVLIDVSKSEPESIVSSIRDGDFGEGGVSAIVMKGSLAVASGQFAFVAYNYKNPGNPVVTPYFQNGTIDFQGPTTCDFDGSAAALGDSAGNLYVFKITDDGLPEFTAKASSIFQAVTSIAVRANLVAANFSGGNFVTLTNFGDQTGSPPFSQTTVGSAAGADPGGALRFFGGHYLVAQTNNGSGVTLLNVSNWQSPSLVGIAERANLNPGLSPTIGLTAFKTKQHHHN
jgi:hypothetical protein